MKESLVIKYTLAPYVRVGFLDGDLHFGFGSLGQLIKEKDLQNCLLDAAILLKEYRSLEEVSEILKSLGHDHSVAEKSMQIISKNFIIPEGVYNSSDRHSRSLLFYSLSGANLDSVQKEISSKKIAVVGCGGIGNIISVLLATAGVQEFILFDNDKIELSNLSRQLMFNESDCGSYKTSVLAKAIKERCSSVNIEEINEFVLENNVQRLSGCDFIVVSGDHYEVNEVINKFAVNKQVPFVNVGYIEDIAVWGPLVIPGRSGCYSCKQNMVNFENLDPEKILKCKKINKGYQPPSNGPVNMMAASLAALDILKFLGNFGHVQSINSRIGLWSHDLHIEKQNYEINECCKVCGYLQKQIR
jgi:hypothetical protein